MYLTIRTPRRLLPTALVFSLALGLFAADASAMHHPTTGRWLSRDPNSEASSIRRVGAGNRIASANHTYAGKPGVGAYKDGMNLYEQVGSNPRNHVDPKGLYEIDVHYYMTFWLAKKIPCFTEEEARQIADANQGVDENPETAPGLPVSEQQRETNRRYHGLSDTHVVRADLAELWGEATFVTHFVVRGVMAVDTWRERRCDLDALGVYLHRMQDGYSHRGSTRDHIRLDVLHSWDKTANDQGRAIRMAGRTWKKLKEWVKACRCDCYEEKIAGKILFREGRQLLDFLKASGGPRRRSINKNELERKRKILGVKER